MMLVESTKGACRHLTTSPPIGVCSVYEDVTLVPQYIRNFEYTVDA